MEHVRAEKSNRSDRSQENIGSKNKISLNRRHS